MEVENCCFELPDFFDEGCFVRVKGGRSAMALDKGILSGDSDICIGEATIGQAGLHGIVICIWGGG